MKIPQERGHAALTEDNIVIYMVDLGGDVTMVTGENVGDADHVEMTCVDMKDYHMVTNRNGWDCRVCII